MRTYLCALAGGQIPIMGELLNDVEASFEQGPGNLKNTFRTHCRGQHVNHSAMAHPLKTDLQLIEAEWRIYVSVN